MKLDNAYAQKLLETPMDRKQFLRYLGVALLAVVGINRVIAMLMQTHPETKKLVGAHPTSKRTFGGGKYGG